jgi:two-component system, cell cycle sensor histidine kinase and response regulator CckA
VTDPASRIAAAYLVVATIWVVLSDWLLYRLGPADVAFGQTAKGLFFVSTTALLLYLFARRESQARRLTEGQQVHLERRHAASARLEAMGRLTGGVAHDFNNLLTAISANIEAFMKDHRDCGHTLTTLDEARSATRRAEELTRRLLAFGRPQPRRPQPVSLNAVIIDMTGLLDRLIYGGIRIVTDLAAEVATVAIDRGRLEQVVMNLAINARDAMPNGGVLRLSTSAAPVIGDEARRLRLEPGHYVRLDVSDTGAGMSEEVRAHIFDAFFTTKPSGSGTGLGLSIVQSILVESGGSVVVRSAPGAGSTFSVYLPASTNQRQAKAAAPRAPARKGGSGGSECVLVAEDDPSVRSLIVRILERRGFEVLEASNGAVALEVLRAGGAQIDMLITDANMPEMDGPTLIAAATESRPDLPVLLISGTSDEEFTTTAPYLAKPFTAGQLSARVREILDG